MPWWRILATSVCLRMYSEPASFGHADSRCDTVSSFSLHSRHLVSWEVFMIFALLIFVGSAWSCAAVMSASVSIFNPVSVSHLNAASLFVVSLICLTYCPWSGLCIHLFLDSFTICLFHSAVVSSGIFHRPLCCTASSSGSSVLFQM